MNPNCREIRKDILKISHSSGHGHIPSCFSVVEAIYSIYDYMRHNPKNPDWGMRDIFILSKGHAALTNYCVLAHFDYFPREAVYAFGAFQSQYGCHADHNKIPGIEVSTGSLGHGIGVAVGVALAAKLKKQPRRVYTLIGDGEANEGSVWEAIQVADSLKLNNLTIIYDNNLSHSRGLQVAHPEKKLDAFGCHVIEVDGHDVDAFKRAFALEDDKVQAIVAHTVKGYGCRILTENQYEWHRKSPTTEQLNEMLEELDAQTI